MKSEVDLYSQKFLCADKPELYVYGDYNSYKGSSMNIQFQLCHDRPDCKSETEIKAFLNDKYFLLLYN